jgi:hypothetical protein
MQGPMTREQLRSLADAAQPVDYFRVTIRRNKVQDVLVLDGATELSRTGDDFRFQVAGTPLVRPVDAILRIDRIAPPA